MPAQGDRGTEGVQNPWLCSLFLGAGRDKKNVLKPGVHVRLAKQKSPEVRESEELLQFLTQNQGPRGCH